MWKNDKDERQILIRGSVVTHALLILCGLLLLNGFLQEGNFLRPWTSVLMQNVIIICATLTAMIIESVARGSYFGRNFAGGSGRRPILFIAVAALLLLGLLFGILNLVTTPTKLVINGKLTDESIKFLYFLWLVIVYWTVVIGWLRNRRNSKNN